jgi:hypothetical protein
MHAGQKVLVGLDGVGDVGVAEPLADDLDRIPSMMSRLPWVWRRSWNRILGRPALCTIRRNDS